MAKPVILFLIDGLQVGGAERSLLLLCQHLEDVTPIVLVLSNSLALKTEFENSGIQVWVKPFPRDYRFWKHAKTLKPLIDSIRPSIIHSSLFHADMILRYLDTPAKKVTGLVSTMYSAGRLSQMSWLTRQKVGILRLWDSWTVSKIDLFIANSNSIKALYQEKVGYPSSKVKVIFRGREIKILNSERRRKTNQFLFVGRLIPSKGLKGAIQAFALFSKIYPGFEFYLAGEGPEKQGLYNLVNTLGLSNQVVFLGHVDNVAELLSESSFFLFPSHYEGLPGALIEAMLAKIPIICSDIPENKECLKEGMCLFHSVGDQEYLFIKMQEAISLKNWGIRTEKAYAYACEHFDIEKIATQYEETYLKLLASP